MVRLILSFVLFSTFLSSHSQLIINLENGFVDWPRHLNPEVIKRNGISSITIEKLIKKDGHPIKDLMDQVTYRFDTRTGLPVEIEDVIELFGRGDTTRTLLNYQEEHLASSSKTGRSRLVTKKYQYDREGRLIEEEKLAITGSEKSDTTWLGFEKMTYSQVSSQGFIRNYYNNCDRLFRQEEFEYDYNGYLLKRIDRKTMSNKQTLYTYRYNDMGLLAGVDITESRKSDEHSWRYTYDDLGNVVSIKETNNGTTNSTYDIVYGDNLLPEALLKHNPSIGEILIYKIHYH